MVKLRNVSPDEIDWIGQFWQKHWGDNFIIVHGREFTPKMVDGVVACMDGQIVGLVTFHIQGQECEVVTLDSLMERRGVGSQLMAAAASVARQRGCQRLFLVTTNDNLAALRFYQKQGLRLCALRTGAVDEARRLKPSIPLLGKGNIPIHDELELEFDLSRRLPGESRLDFG